MKLKIASAQEETHRQQNDRPAEIQLLIDSLSEYTKRRSAAVDRRLNHFLNGIHEVTGLPAQEER
jgi:hypothetical protein